MKKKKYGYVIVAFIVCVVLAGCSKDYFDGSRTGNPDAYLLTFSYMNQKDEHTLELAKGDTLCVEYEIEKGDIDVTIGIEGEEPLYKGDDIATGTFELPIEEAGNYTIAVDARRAAGTMNFTVIQAEQTEENSKESEQDNSYAADTMDSAEKSDSDIETQNPDAYGNLIKTYETALSEGWGGGRLMENNLNFMMANCYGSNPFEQIGYWTGDMDGDGTDELVVGTTAAVTDDFYGKLIFDCYTLDANGSCVKVFGSEERNRYYYAGDNRFVNVGSSGAADSFETVVKYEAGKLNADVSAAVPSEYVQIDFLAFEGSVNVTDIPEEPVTNAGDTALEMPILDEINQNVTVGTTGSYMTAVQSAVKLLDWAAGTGLDQEEIRDATVAWLMDKGNDEQISFAAKLEQVDLAYQKLLTDEAAAAYTAAGCEPEMYPWGADAVEIVEVIMEVVGLR